MTLLEAFFLTVVVVLLLHIWLRHPRCADCGAKAAPSMANALVRINHRAERAERALAEWVSAHSESMPYGIGDQPGHVHTDQCSFDRNSSLSCDTYVCMCGWPFEPLETALSEPAVSERNKTEA